MSIKFICCRLVEAKSEETNERTNDELCVCLFVLCVTITEWEKIVFAQWLLFCNSYTFRTRRGFSFLCYILVPILIPNTPLYNHFWIRRYYCYDMFMFNRGYTIFETRENCSMLRRIFVFVFLTVAITEAKIEYGLLHCHCVYDVCCLWWWRRRRWQRCREENDTFKSKSKMKSNAHRREREKRHTQTQKCNTMEMILYDENHIRYIRIEILRYIDGQRWWWRKKMSNSIRS